MGITSPPSDGVMERATTPTCGLMSVLRSSLLRSGSYIKRERVKDAEVLVSRLVDRPLRPMFEAGWSNETQARAP